MSGWIASLYLSEPGKLEVCRVAVSDISEAKRAQDQVLMTQAQVLSSMAEGVCVCDETGRISFTNAAFEAMFGYNRSGLLLSKEIFDFEDCLDGEISPRLPEGFSQVLTKGYWRGDLLGCKRSGERFNAHVRLTRLVLFGTTSIICVWEDISVLKQAERELREK